MNEGDFLTCKRTLYNTNDIFKDEILSYKERISNFFRTPVFKKNNKYQIKLKSSALVSTNSTTANPQNPSTSPISAIMVNYYKINNCVFTDVVMDRLFYTKSEERYMKLKHLKDKYDKW